LLEYLHTLTSGTSLRCRTRCGRSTTGERSMTLWPEARRLLTLLQESGLRVRMVAEAGEVVAEVKDVFPPGMFRLCFVPGSGALLLGKSSYVAALGKAGWPPSQSGLSGSSILWAAGRLPLLKKQQLVDLLSRLVR